VDVETGRSWGKSKSGLIRTIGAVRLTMGVPEKQCCGVVAGSQLLRYGLLRDGVGTTVGWRPVSVRIKALVSKMRYGWLEPPALSAYHVSPSSTLCCEHTDGDYALAECFDHPSSSQVHETRGERVGRKETRTSGIPLPQS